VTVRASNLVSNESATKTFIVERPVVGVSINVSTEYIQLGTEVFFEAVINGASDDVHCDWYFGDLESAFDAGNHTLLLSLRIFSACFFHCVICIIICYEVNVLDVNKL